MQGELRNEGRRRILRLAYVPAAYGEIFLYSTSDPTQNTAARLVATPTVETVTMAKREVEMLQPPWIAHNFSEHLQIIANHQFQSLISVSRLP